MKDIQNAVTVYLQAETGIRTVADRTRCREYPLLAVSVQERGTVLIAGGRLAEHSYEVCVTAVSDRDRDGQTQLLSSLTIPLLRGIPLVQDGEQRMLHPLNIHAEGENLRFDLTVCRTVPPAEIGSGNATHTMDTLHVSI